MGYSVHRFPIDIDDNLLCGICRGVLEDAVLTPCGHSFCSQCVTTWLNKPLTSSCTASSATLTSTKTNTCPECRTTVFSIDLRPVHFIRNFIQSLEVSCEHTSRGCSVLLKLESMASHLPVCGFAPVDCAGCGLPVNRSQLADHHVRCDAISVLVSSTGENLDSTATTCRTSRPSLAYQTSSDLSTRSFSNDAVSDLRFRVANLEIKLKRMKRDLEIAESKNRKLDRELVRTKEELEAKRDQLLDLQYIDFDPDYEYGYLPSSIVKLSGFIARFLNRKPTYVDKNKLFASIKRCFENYGRDDGQYQSDVHMLVSTAYASDWFTDNQLLNFHCWLQSIARLRQYNVGTTQ